MNYYLAVKSKDLAVPKASRIDIKNIVQSVKRKSKRNRKKNFTVQCHRGNEKHSHKTLLVLEDHQQVKQWTSNISE